MKPTNEMIAAAWQAWHKRHSGKLGPGPAFVEAIEAALAVMQPVRWQPQFDDGNWSNALYTETEVKEFKASPRGTVIAYRPLYAGPELKP